MTALSPRQRWLILGSVLVVTLVLVFWPQKEPPEPTPARRPAAASGQGAAPAQAPTPAQAAAKPAAGPAAPGGPLQIARAAPPAEEPKIPDIFAKQSWFVPPPPPPPGPPEPPPLPFTYLGKLIDNGQVTVYLADQQRNLVVRQGDVIDGTYRVKQVSPAAVTLVYIPLNKPQTLAIGRSN